ncbi:MAG: hypothetical protein IJI68_06540 [Eggerthellaceae bacterium]|nr:hypothetical protein [Eggerthellaceae bacterium]
MGFKLGLAQCCHPADGDVVRMVDEWAGRAKEAQVDLLVFPESLMTPFEQSPEEFAKAAEPLDGPFCQAVDQVASRHGIWMVYTANERGGTFPFNTAVVVDDAGKRHGIYRKAHLFDTDFVKESDKISGGDSLFAPIDTPFCKLGLGICYDVRFPELARTAALSGCQLLVYPAAWVDGSRKVEQWRTLLAARAIENEIFVAGLSRCDRGFGKAQRDYAGHSCVFGPLGEELASAGVAEQLLVADIDLAAIDAARAAMPVLDHRRPELYG